MEQPNKPFGFPAREILVPALKVGALSGTTGLLYGGVAGVLRSAHPVLFAVAAGIQWSALGSTFWATRATIFHAYYPSPSQRDRLTASTVAGGITGGTIGGVFRGPRNIIPGTIMFTLFGYLGQSVYNRLDARHSEQVASDAQAVGGGDGKDGKGLWERVAEMKWSPLTALSDEDYGNMLKEKLLRVEAEITLVNEKIERLKAEERRGEEPPKPTT